MLAYVVARSAALRESGAAFSSHATTHQHSPLRLALRLQRSLEVCLSEGRARQGRLGGPRRRRSFSGARARKRRVGARWLLSQRRGGRCNRRRQLSRSRRLDRLLLRWFLGVRHVVHGLHARGAPKHARPRVQLRSRGSSVRQRCTTRFRRWRCGYRQSMQRALRGGSKRRRGDERGAQLGGRKRSWPRRRRPVRARQALEAFLVTPGIAAATRVHAYELRRAVRAVSGRAARRGAQLQHPPCLSSATE